MTLDELREKAGRLPLTPGVYQMKDKAGVIIYVGKAKHLKNRVSQYFQNTERHTPKVAGMVRHVDDFEVIMVGSEFEALVLENILIKRFQPRYNIKLKDDKTYPFIRLDMSEEWPRFTNEPKKLGDKARYFGPYGGHGVANEAIETISRALRLPSCSRKFPDDIGKGRPCLNSHMNRCVAVCSGNVTNDEYRALIAQGCKLLEGRYDELVADIEREMNDAAEALLFEKAAELRDRAESVRRLGNKQKIITENLRDGDAVAYASATDGSVGAIALLRVAGGMIVGKFHVITDRADEAEVPELLTDFILQYYSEREGDEIPKKIFTASEPDASDALAEILTERAGKKVELILPKRGEKHALVELARVNALEEADRVARREARSVRAPEELGELLGLPEAPKRIESYDISNTGDEGIVGGMVVFVDGKPAKKYYRKFKIQGKTTQDDLYAMSETLSRRFTDLRAGKEGFAEPPDLVLIDGGPNQLRAVIEATGHGYNGSSPTPMFGMIKDDRHRTRALVAPDGAEIGLTARPAAFSLVGRIQEETHRFAIGYHRTLRDKKKIASALDGIDGVGEARRTALLKRFKSAKNVASAEVDELRQVVPIAVARKVYEYFHPGGAV